LPYNALQATDLKQPVDLVVTASKTPQAAQHIGSNFTILTQAMLEKRGDRSVADSLSRVPSLSFSRSGGIGGQTSIRLRGANSGQTLVLIDGIRVGDISGIDDSFDFSTLLVADIERIEILRGNQSALYGSDAIGGVIHIITHKREIGLAVNGFAEGGAFGTHHTGIAVKGGDEKKYYGISVNHFHNNGFSRRNTGQEADGTDISHIKGNLGFDLTENLSFSASGGFEAAYFDYDSGFSASQLPFGQKKIAYAQAQATHYALQDRLKNQIYYRFSQTDRYDNDGGNFITHFNSVMHNVGYQSDFNFLKRDVVTLGIDHRYGRSNRQFDMHNTALFMNIIKGFGDHITWSLGGRIDAHSQIETKATYRTSLAYNVPITASKFHASLGSGFKAPSLFQLFDVAYGNPNLKPEQSIGWDFGLTQSLFDKNVTVDISFFKTQFTDLIDFTFPAGYANIGKATIQGIEFSGDAKINSIFSVFCNYSFTDAENDLTDLTLARRPKHLVNLGFDAQLKEISLNFTGRYVGDQLDSAFTGHNQAFFTANMQTVYKISDSLKLYGRVENLFDHDYQEVLTYNTAGISAFAGIKLYY